MLSKKFTAVAGAAAAAADDYFKNTTLLLSGDGTNGAQNNTFTDSSTNNFSITRNGNTTQGTFSPYSPAGGSWSNYFNSASDSIGPGSNAAFGFGTGDFSIELWFYPLTNSATNTMFANGAGASGSIGLYLTSSGKIELACYGGSNLNGATTVTANTWHHIVATRSGTTMRVFLDGVLDGSSTNAFNNTSNTISIGGIWSTLSSGYISNLRVCKGAIPTSYQTSSTTAGTVVFIPPTAPLTTTSQGASGVSLITCQSNRFVDNNNTYTFTTSGTPSVQRFSPFNPTEAYSTSTVGGSGYFDDSGDYLTTSSSAISYTGDFCIECWFYTNTTKTYACIYSDENTGVGGTILLNNGSNNGQITVYCGSISNFASTSTGLNNNAWHHVAFTRSGSTVRLFIDGKLENTTTASGTITTPSTFRIGTSFFSNRDFLGYISGFRCVSGSAVYTSAFTPPTSPPTAITNTSLLLNFTNAGIYDSAMMNDLETVGNAQISTSTKKYGTGAMYFDGTGDWLVAPTTPNCSFETGDFTLEGWVYPSAVTGTDRCLWDTRAASGDAGMVLFINSTGNLSTYSSSAIRITSTGTLTANTWQHIALVRSSGTMAFYINGTQSGTLSYSTAITCPGRVWVGVRFDAAAPYTGYIDDFRITKGYARYTSNFTAPTEALPNY